MKNGICKMKAYTYIKQGEFEFTEKEKPTILDVHDAIVKVTLSSICTSDLHIKHGCVNDTVLISHWHLLPSMCHAQKGRREGYAGNNE